LLLLIQRETPKVSLHRLSAIKSKAADHRSSFNHICDYFFIN
jgi:hypothetical protein